MAFFPKRPVGRGIFNALYRFRRLPHLFPRRIFQCGVTFFSYFFAGRAFSKAGNGHLFRTGTAKNSLSGRE